MRGITEERLRELLRNEPIPNSWSEVLSQCTELNPWQPIDENTPRDRPLQLFYSETKNQPKFQRIDSYYGKSEMCVTPTHWQELPEDPKE